MRRAKLLDPQPVPVRTDIFVHNLDARTLENIRCALAQGLVPTAVDFGGDDDTIVVLRLAQPRGDRRA
jgi:hypothetical protein